jgi:hypothetical protein
VQRIDEPSQAGGADDVDRRAVVGGLDPRRSHAPGREPRCDGRR